MDNRVRFVTVALFDIVQLEPSLGEAEWVLGISEVIDDLFLLALKRTGDVLQACVESLLFGEPCELRLFVTCHQGFEVTLLAAFDDGGRREAEVPALLDRYLAMLLASVKAILIIQQILYPHQTT